MDAIHVLLNGDRGVATVHGLVAAGHGVRRVVVPADRANGAAADACRELAIDVLGVDDVNGADHVELVGAADLLVVAGYSTILRRPVIDAARLGAVNLHAGRLPQYRGGSPLNWQLMNGEAEAVCSVIRVDEGVDTGDVLAEASLPIGPADTIGTLHERANACFPRLVVEVAERFERGDLAGRVQDEAEAAYWHQRNDGDGHLDWTRHTAASAERFARALTRPYPGAWSWLGNERVRVLAAELTPTAIHGVAGRIVWLGGVGPHVVASDRAVLLTDYEIEGRPDGRLPHGRRLT